MADEDEGLTDAQRKLVDTEVRLTVARKRLRLARKAATTAYERAERDETSGGLTPHIQLAYERALVELTQATKEHNETVRDYNDVRGR